MNFLHAILMMLKQVPVLLIYRTQKELRSEGFEVTAQELEIIYLGCLGDGRQTLKEFVEVLRASKGSRQPLTVKQAAAVAIAGRAKDYVATPDIDKIFPKP